MTAQHATPAATYGLGIFAVFHLFMPLLTGFGLLDVPGFAMGATLIPISPVQLSLIGLIALALALGLLADPPLGRLSTPVKLAVLGLSLAFIYSTLFNSLWPAWIIPRAMMRVPAVLGAIALVFLFLRASPRGRLWVVSAIALQPVVHLPMLLWAYVEYAQDAAYNWNQGPLGFANVRVWGMLTATSFAMTTAYLAHLGSASSVRMRVTCAAALVLLATLLFFSGTRAGVLGVLIGLPIGWLILPSGMARAGLIAAAALMIGAALSTLIPPPSPNYGIFNALERLIEGVGGRDVTSGRLTLWTVGAAMVLDHPIFGHGLDQLILFDPPEFSQHHLHNTPLQLFFDFGIVGGVAALVLLGAVWRRAITNGRQEAGPVASAALFGLVTLIAMCPFEDILYHTDLLATTMILTAVLLSPSLASSRAKR